MVKATEHEKKYCFNIGGVWYGKCSKET
jgi:hypothetical protein